MGAAAFDQLFDFTEEFCDKAAECGHRSFVILAGTLDRLAVKAEKLSHEGTFGVGYGVCTYEVEGRAPERDFLRQYEEKIAEEVKRRKESEDAYVRLARQTIEAYVGERRQISIPKDLPEEMYESRAGVFVSLKEEGRLRGCIGTITPVQKSIAEEIIANAISASTKDPRFHPVQSDELDKLVYSVDVLGTPEAITSPDELDVKRYGVIVTKGRKRGLLLPNLDGSGHRRRPDHHCKTKGGHLYLR